MISSGFTNAPISKYLLIYTIASSVALAILDVKHLAHVQVSPHLWQYGQFWRTLIWQGAGFANSTETLFAAMLIYHLRIIERAWGGRKMISFLLQVFPYTTLLPPLLLAMVVRPLSLNTLNYLPSGPTAIVFALLAQYYASIPHTYRYRISTKADAPDAHAPEGTSSTSSKYLTLLLSDKSTTYLVAAQLALSQFPAGLLPAVTGWVVGLAWRADLIPCTSWRVPAWMVGEKVRTGNTSGSGGSTGNTERYRDLRRRLEGETAAASTGVDVGSRP
ncbi:hypothetical protein ASPZODRAFT_129874 [Penicilliopsis zonata CBS 506.65]|uniref:Peptidase S54 rhomboid domain-containing protein n=1 Tax=Penicilliopsis zonata CBS 506.65 TaxID=1073090 RepID=A0A1L9SQB6_9EURO|nr:hypothetical protein ASPZODRAFT_129874 [Penicilliopsis zonata CBS 506.65]OJJ49420.1 hypothetical protein ASPZODRAFT_129874 [Penicilliopsis zonata CBS 506.65]